MKTFVYAHLSPDHITQWILLSIFECCCCHPFISKWIFESDPPRCFSKMIIIHRGRWEKDIDSFVLSLPLIADTPEQISFVLRSIATLHR